MSSAAGAKSVQHYLMLRPRELPTCLRFLSQSAAFLCQSAATKVLLNSVTATMSHPWKLFDLLHFTSCNCCQH